MERWRSITKTATVALTVLLLSIPAFSDFQGSLQYNTGLEATDDWANTDTQIDWYVYQNPNSSWHYEYTLTTTGPAISHWIIELTEPVEDGDLFNFTGDWAAYEILNNTAGTQINPSMPDDEYGIKFEWDEGGHSESVSFDSWRVPVWQDFYARCGATGGTIDEVWNLGFTSNDDPDPTDPASDGTVDNHILAPDGYVPEPATTVLFGLGLAGLIGTKLRERREA